MSALAYDVKLVGPRGGKSTVTLWANSADQAARRAVKQHAKATVKAVDRSKSVA